MVIGMVDDLWGVGWRGWGRVFGEEEYGGGFLVGRRRKA